MSRITLLAALGLAVLLMGCAKLEVYPANEVGVKDKEGIPYYLPKPILIVGADLSCRIEYIPDLTKEYIIQTTNAGTFERELTLTQGWQFVGLTESGTDTTSGIIEALAAAASGVAQFTMVKGIDTQTLDAEYIKANNSLKPGVYYFSFSADGIELKSVFK
jgi:hypothetical protein